jgi:hypothetical protein
MTDMPYIVQVSYDRAPKTWEDIAAFKYESEAMAYATRHDGIGGGRTRLHIAYTTEGLDTGPQSVSPVPCP